MLASTPSYRTLVRNVLATALARLVAIVLALVLATVLVRMLGLTAYGTWSVFFLFIGYGALFDAGLSVSVEAAVARAWQRRDPAAIARLLDAAIVLAVALSAILQAIVALVPRACLLLGGEPATFARALAVLPICLFCSNVAALAGAAVAGLQRGDRLAVLRIAFGTLSTAAVLALALAGVRDVAPLLGAYAAGLLLTGVAAWRAVAAAGVPVRLRPWRLDRTALGELTRVGGTVQVTTLVSQLGDSALRLLLGARFGAPAMGAYDLAMRAAIAPRSLSASLLVTLVPFAAGREAAHGRADLAAMIGRSARYTTLFLVAVSLPLVAAADLVVVSWLGPIPEAATIAAMLRVLAVSLVIQTALAPIVSAARGVQEAGPEAVVTLVMQPLIIAAAAVPRDAVAAVAVVAIGLAAGAAVLWTWLVRRLRLGTIPGIHPGRLVLLATGVAAAVAGARLATDAAGVPPLAVVAACCGASVLATVALGAVVGVVDPDERRLVLARVRGRAGVSDGVSPT